MPPNQNLGCATVGPPQNFYPRYAPTPMIIFTISFIVVNITSIVYVCFPLLRIAHAHLTNTSIKKISNFL